MAIALIKNSEISKAEAIANHLEICQQEQIHLLGRIQPHGILIGINKSELKIVRISENTTHFFNLPATHFIDQTLSILFPKEIKSML